jgi:hypothetical protein
MKAGVAVPGVEEEKEDVVVRTTRRKTGRRPSARPAPRRGQKPWPYRNKSRAKASALRNYRKVCAQYPRLP